MKLCDVEILSYRLRQVPINMKYAFDIFVNFTEDVTEYMYPKAAGCIEEIESFIEGSMKGLEEGSNLQLVILDRVTGEFLGCSGFHKADTETPELGIWIKKAAHGNGYGFEAISSIIAWARENKDFQNMLYSVDRRNRSSRRIPEMHGGVVNKEYKLINLSGNELDILEYWITNGK